MSRYAAFRVALVTFAVAAAAPLAAPLAAQGLENGETGRRELLPRAREIALARSAAPPSVSADASVYVLTGAGYELAIESGSGVACYVSRDWLSSIEPHCFDPEGAATIMRINMRRVSLLHAGMTIEAANARVAEELLAGDLRLPRRPVMSWMQSSAQQLVAPDGREVGAWKPHVMIYYPNLTAADIGMPAEPTAQTTTMISEAGTPMSTIVVVVPDFVEPPVAEADAP